jgi:glycosyltransferase involved in cell wall biosynthesis
MRGYPWHVAVLIPALNEEQLMARCLTSVIEAISCLPGEVTSDVIVVDDNSADRTAVIAKEILGRSGTVVRARANSVGTARAMAAQQGLARYRGPLERCWLANTDADCVVPPSWLIDQLSLANRGAEAIAGTVSVDSFAEHGPEVAGRFRETYKIEPDGSHAHVHGANLGIRADAYIRAGGWADMVTAEDHDLWRRMIRARSALVSTSRTQVITSGRRIGRAPSGFAAALAAHNHPAA